MSNVAALAARKAREAVPASGGDALPEAAPPPLWVDLDGWSEADIPRREWVAPGYALRGAVTVLSGAGGVSKSTIAAAWGAALALGKPLGSFKPTAPGKAVIFNVEDDAIEQRRRLSAILRQFDARPDDLAGRLVRVGPHSAGALVERDAKTGRVAMTAAFEQIEAIIETHRPDLAIFDPLVELHNAEENDNTAVRAVIAQFRALAAKHKIAVVLVHHSKKGVSDKAGDVDTMRGASAIAGAARIVLTVTQMTGQEAEGFGMNARHAAHYFRLDGAKANYSALACCEWFERQQIELDNGEIVAAPVAWMPPKAAAGADVVAAVLADIARGSPDGPWSPQLGGGVRSIRQCFVRHGVEVAANQTRLLGELTTTHGVTIGTYTDEYRKPVKGLRTAEGLPAGARWLDATSQK